MDQPARWSPWLSVPVDVSGQTHTHTQTQTHMSTHKPVVNIHTKFVKTKGVGTKYIHPSSRSQWHKKQTYIYIHMQRVGMRSCQQTRVTDTPTRTHTLCRTVRNIHDCSRFGSISLIPTHNLRLTLLCFSKMSPNTAPIISHLLVLAATRSTFSKLSTPFLVP